MGLESKGWGGGAGVGSEWNEDMAGPKLPGSRVLGSLEVLALFELTVELVSPPSSSRFVGLWSMREVVERDFGIRKWQSTRLVRVARSRRRSILDGGGVDCSAEIRNHGGKVEGESDLGLKTSDENMV